MSFIEKQYLIDGVLYNIMETIDVHTRIRNGKFNNYKYLIKLISFAIKIIINIIYI